VERDSITEYGERLVTVVLELPRIVLAELNTHRVFTRSSASSRAIPVEKMIARVKEDPFFPVYWGKNQKGMQAEQELSQDEIQACREVWLSAADAAITHARALLAIGVHKQITNRLLEPFLWHTVIITATEWSNWDHLRCDKEAQPEIRKGAEMVLECRNASRPKLLSELEWHLPFGAPDDRDLLAEGDLRSTQGSLKEDLVKISVGRSARVSYLNHDGKRDLVDDLGLSSRVLKSGHMAPWEHVARPMTSQERTMFHQTRWSACPGSNLTNISRVFTEDWRSVGSTHFLGNFNGWVQARKRIYGEWDVKAFEQ
jgi:thymidylate synthase ThyX